MQFRLDLPTNLSFPLNPLSAYFFRKVGCSMLLFIKTIAIGQVSFTASADTKQIPIGEVFEVKFQLKNANGTSFRPPTFNDFTVVGGPNRMNSMTMVNGVASNSETYSYVLQAKKEGVFTIGAGQITVKGQTLSSAPFTIAVIKGKALTQGDLTGAKGDVFLRAEVNTQEARIGQQIILDYKLYTRVNVNGINTINEPDYAGFFKLGVEQYPHNDNRVTFNGKTYLSRIIQRIALFPTKEGDLEINPLNITVGIVSNSAVEDPFESFFGSFQTESKRIASNAVKIFVKPMPNNAPVGFSGAVGDFHAQFALSQTEGTTDDVLSLKISITGNGDAKRWQAPKLPPTEGLVIYDPKLLTETSTESNGEWQTTKEYEYLIAPKQSGAFTIQPTVIYFEPTEGGRFKNISQSFTLKISQGSNKAAAIAADKVQDIRGIKTATQFKDGFYTFYGSPLYWLSLGMPVLAVLGVLLWKQKNRNDSRRDLTQLKRDNAAHVATQRLAQAKVFLDKNDTRAFYDEVSKTFFNYAADTLGLPLADFTKASLREKFEGLAMPESIVSDYINVLNRCEIALFAGLGTEPVPIQSVEGAMTLYHEAVKVLSAVDAFVKRNLAQV